MLSDMKMGAPRTSIVSARPDAHPSCRADSTIVAHTTGVRTMADYRIRLITRDGSKKQPVRVKLDPELKPKQLREQMIGEVRRHDLEWGNDPDKWVKHYGLEVLKLRTDDIVTVYRG